QQSTDAGHRHGDPRKCRATGDRARLASEPGGCSPQVSQAWEAGSSRTLVTFHQEFATARLHDLPGLGAKSTKDRLAVGRSIDFCTTGVLRSTPEGPSCHSSRPTA